MNKHTPGPWRAGAFDETIGYDCMTGGVTVSGANGATVVVVDAADYGQNRCQQPDLFIVESVTANARLIAAAPDLLAALEWALSDAEDIAERQAIAADLGVSEWESFMPKWAADARAAIAKARGEC